jgi:hypothetical protein
MLSALFRTNIPDEALEYAGFVLAHCAAVADEHRLGELICPFAVLVDENGRHVVDFESESQAEAVEKGWRTLPDAKSRKQWWAFGREGTYRAPDNSAADVLTVTVWLPKMKHHISVLQKFFRGPNQELRLQADVELLKHEGETASLVEEWNRAAFDRGIAAHPQGSRWKEWRGDA